MAYTEIIQILGNRFGNANQIERFRDELRGRRKKPGESFQSVYNDIMRLMSLAFPGKGGELYDIIARDAFLEALDDPALRVRILDQSPKDADEVLSHATRMLVYSQPTVSTGDNGNDNDARRRVRFVSTSPVRESEADRRIRSLEKQVREQNDEIKTVSYTHLTLPTNREV